MRFFWFIQLVTFNLARPQPGNVEKCEATLQDLGKHKKEGDTLPVVATENVEKCETTLQDL